MFVQAFEGFLIFIMHIAETVSMTFYPLVWDLRDLTSKYLLVFISIATVLWFFV